MFNKYPYTDNNQLNLDWFLEKFKELYDSWVQFKAETEQEIDDFETAMTNDFNDLLTQFEDFKTYVTTYLDNLDYAGIVADYIEQMVDNGTFLNLMRPSISSEVTTWLNDNVEPTTPVIDSSLTISGAGADAYVTGAQIRQMHFVNDPIIDVYEIETGHLWNNSTGEKNTASGWSCSKQLIPIQEFQQGIYCNELEDTSLVVYITCFDVNKTYLNYVAARSITSTNKVWQKLLNNTAYIGLSVQNTSLTHIRIRRFLGADVVEYPFNDINYKVIDNSVVNADGTISTNSNFMVITLPEVNDSDVFYTNVKYPDNLYCLDGDNHFIGTATRTDIERHGIIFTPVPGTKIMRLNISKGDLHGDVSSVVYYRIGNTENILAIGDSLTWLDGAQNTSYDGATLFLGWQKQLEKNGYKVTSAGFNGLPYANGTTANDSIYNHIVVNQYDVSTYDTIILFGGTNDNLYSVPLGTRPTSYDIETFDTYTFNGALGGIIKYIRENNSHAKIILCTCIKSEASSRNYPNAIRYVEEIRFNADFWGCYLNDLFKNLNVSPQTTEFDSFFYDNTHLNKNGMIRLGKLMLDAVNMC